MTLPRDVDAIRARDFASADRATLGRLGEAAAADHLTALGYRVLERNVRVGDDEADILALTPQGALAVIEVKTRRGPWHPEERVDQVKRQRQVRLARALATQPRWRDRLFQFDVVAVGVVAGRPPQVMHYPHAFDASGAP